VIEREMRNILADEMAKQDDGLDGAIEFLRSEEGLTPLYKAIMGAMLHSYQRGVDDASER